MIYNDYITTEHQLAVYDGYDYVYLANGNYYVVPDDLSMTTTIDMYTYLGRITNWAKQQYQQPIVAISSSDGQIGCDLFFTNRCDFVQFEGYGSNALQIGYTIDNLYISQENASLSQQSTIEYDLTSYLNYNSRNVGYYEVDLDNVGSYSVFDYNNVVYGSLQSEYLTIRGEDTTFYRTGFYINNYEGEGFNDDYGVIFSTGNIYQSIRQEGFDSGFTNGWTNGRVDGFDSGYQAGLNSAGDYAQGGAFNFITSAFECVSSIMDIEVLPHVTLGLCFSIPLVFTLILVIFRLVRK